MLPPIGTRLIDSVPPATIAVRDAAHDALGGVRDRLQARRAEAIDRHRRRGHRHAGAQAGDARDVQALLGLRHRAAEDHVVDLGGVERRARAAALRAITVAASSSGRVPRSVPFGALPTGGADGGNDDCVFMSFAVEILQQILDRVADLADLAVEQVIGARR